MVGVFLGFFLGRGTQYHVRLANSNAPLPCCSHLLYFRLMGPCLSIVFHFCDDLDSSYLCSILVYFILYSESVVLNLRLTLFGEGILSLLSSAISLWKFLFFLAFPLLDKGLDIVGIGWLKIIDRVKNWEYLAWFFITCIVWLPLCHESRLMPELEGFWWNMTLLTVFVSNLLSYSFFFPCLPYCTLLLKRRSDSIKGRLGRLVIEFLLSRCIWVYHKGI